MSAHNDWRAKRELAYDGHNRAAGAARRKAAAKHRKARRLTAQSLRLYVRARAIDNSAAA